MIFKTTLALFAAVAHAGSCLRKQNSQTASSQKVIKLAENEQWDDVWKQNEDKTKLIKNSMYPNPFQTLLHMAVKQNNYEAAKILIERNHKQIYETDSFGQTVLHYAALYANGKMIEMLCERGADIKAIARNPGNQTALHVAAENGKHENAKMLVHCGAIKEAISSINHTPLQLAAICFDDVDKNDRSKTVIALIRAGAKIEAEDEYKQTPLLLAAKFCRLHTFVTLMESNANVKAKNNVEKCALEIMMHYSNDRYILERVAEILKPRLKSLNCTMNHIMSILKNKDLEKIQKMLFQSNLHYVCNLKMQVKKTFKYKDYGLLNN